jgi:SAGA-associated factor 29
LAQIEELSEDGVAEKESRELEDSQLPVTPSTKKKSLKRPYEEDQSEDLSRFRRVRIKTSKPSEPSSNSEITFAVGARVAFKPKIQNQLEEHEWIQGMVVDVIGEGKSRRYDVLDPFPDDPSRLGVAYRLPASSMIPISPTGAPSGPYEVGTQVLALFPESTAFYPAEVKDALKNGSKVMLLFEGDIPDALRVVDRRFVLDYRVVEKGGQTLTGEGDPNNHRNHNTQWNGPINEGAGASPSLRNLLS